jgi:hypothetical protein
MQQKNNKWIAICQRAGAVRMAKSIVVDREASLSALLAEQSGRQRRSGHTNHFTPDSDEAIATFPMLKVRSLPTTV